MKTRKPTPYPERFTDFAQPHGRWHQQPKCEDQDNSIFHFTYELGPNNLSFVGRKDELIKLLRILPNVLSEMAGPTSSY